MNSTDDVIVNFFQGHNHNFKILNGVVVMFEYLLTTITSNTFVSLLTKRGLRLNICMFPPTVNLRIATRPEQRTFLFACYRKFSDFIQGNPGCPRTVGPFSPRVASQSKRP